MKARQTSSLMVLPVLLTGMMLGQTQVINITQPPYSCDSSGKTDVTTCIQRAMDSSISTGVQGGNGLPAHVVVFFPPGSYLISGSLTVHQDYLSLVGAEASWDYKTGQMAANIVACSPQTPKCPRTGFTGNPEPGFYYTTKYNQNETALLDASRHTHLLIKNLGVQCSNISNQDGIFMGTTPGTLLSLVSEITNNSIGGCNLGIHIEGTSVAQIKSNNIVVPSGSTAGATGMFLVYFYDSQIEDNYIHVSPKYVPSSSWDVQGNGITWLWGSNTTLRGGKLEWNAGGVYIHEGYGIIISDINFDNNRAHNIIVRSGGPAVNSMSITITGNRFLAGASITDKHGDYPGAGLVFEADKGGITRAVITGNSFRKAGACGSDVCTTGEPTGPSNEAIYVNSDSSTTSGTHADIVVSGNDFIDSAGTSSSKGAAIVVNGANSHVHWCGNQNNLARTATNSGYIGVCDQ